MQAPANSSIILFSRLLVLLCFFSVFRLGARASVKDISLSLSLSLSLSPLPSPLSVLVNTAVVLGTACRQLTTTSQG